MKKIINFIALAILCQFFMSCQKKAIHETASSGELPSVLTYMKALTQETDAQFGISSTANMFSTTIDVIFQGSALDENKNATNIGTVHLGNYNFLPDNHNLYGKNTPIDNRILGSVANLYTEGASNSNADKFVLNESLYIPSAMELKGLNLSQDVEKNIITIGQKYSWETDPNNKNNGIIIVVEYNPLVAGNSVVKSTYPNYIRNGIVVDDNGGYSMESPLFEGIPKNSELVVSFIRLNYKINQTKAGKNYLFYSLSTKYLNLKYP